MEKIKMLLPKLIGPLVGMALGVVLALYGGKLINVVSGVSETVDSIEVMIDTNKVELDSIAIDSVKSMIKILDCADSMINTVTNATK